MKKSSKLTYPTVLFIGAMDRELHPLLKTVGISKTSKILDTFPLYETSYKSVKMFTVQTYVGDVNASIAGFKAIQEVNPDYVIKFGTVGGSYPESKAGDIIIPLGFFHRGGWITRNNKTHTPTADASTWDSVFGEKDYQIQESRNNLGGIPYYFPVCKNQIVLCKNILRSKNLKFQTAYIGGGNMWMFDQSVLANVGECMLPKTKTHKRFVSDMESYALAHACYLNKKPFIGCYIVASNDYLDEPYDPIKVTDLCRQLVPYVLELTTALCINNG